MKIFNRMLRAAAVVAAVAVSAVLLSGCDGNDNPGNNGGNNTGGGNSTGGGSGASTRLGADDAVPAGAIKIASFDDLCKIGKDPAFPVSGTYEVTKNIDASASRNMNSGKGFEPIGMTTPRFTGKFYGKGYTINGLYINRPDDEYVGLFGYISGATVSGVHLVNVSVTGRSYVGGLVGQNFGDVSKSSVVGGLVTANQSSMYAAGGLAGGNYRTVTDCYSTAKVVSSYAGGLVGWGGGGGTTSRSYSTGAVNGSSNCVGGLVGLLFGTITDSYSTSTVVGGSGGGGLVGSVNSLTDNPVITNCYAVGAVSITGSGTDRTGGILGSIASGTVPTITSCYWNTETTGLSTSAGTGASGKTTAQMKQKSTYSGWDFSSVWNIDGGYPYLRSLGPTAATPPNKVAAASGAFAASVQPMSEAEAELTARAERQKMLSEELRHARGE